jgi:hypothetical protein
MVRRLETLRDALQRMQQLLGRMVRAAGASGAGARHAGAATAQPHIPQGSATRARINRRLVPRPHPTRRARSATPTSTTSGCVFR